MDVEEIARDYTRGMSFDYAEDVLTVFEKGLERADALEGIA